MDVHSLLSSASYSPMALGHLPQPVPNDLPRGLDAKVFTFQDAFEDLLVASKGQKLPDIRTRHQQRQLLWNMFPNGEPAWFWLRRLESQGLVRPFDPFTFIRTHQPVWSTLHEQRHPRAVDPWGELFGDGSAVDDERRVNQGKQRHGPDTFDELFSAISSAFQEGKSTWDTFINNIVQNGEADRHDKNLPAPADCGKKDVVTTEKEYVDWFGYLHKTVKRQILDAEGKVVGCETHVTIRPADKHINNVDKEEGNQQTPSETPNSAKKSSWFGK
ncbi:hypothetical protein E4U53_000548 [Claviceps sorghi]|nr:hypothetical protein E4U53_000548 [Claviceps sorghi]